MIDAVAYWGSAGVEVQAALIGAFATLITGAIGFGAIIVQIGVQGRANRKHVDENERRRLKSEFYEQTVTVSAALQDAATNFSTSMRVLGTNYLYAAITHAKGEPVHIQVAGMPEIMAAHTAMSDAAVSFVFMIERRQIVDPRLLVFRTAMSVALDAVNRIYNERFVPVAIPMLPAQLPNGTRIFNIRPVNEAESFSGMCAEIANTTANITTCVEDFSVEMQNLLLGDLFNNEAAHRQPIDPASRVIRLDRHAALERDMMANTDWGRNIARLEENARQTYAVPSNGGFISWVRRRLGRG